MHAADFAVGLLGATGTVGATVPIATGAAWALAAGGRTGSR